MPLNLSLDTAQAFHWMRFAGYLKWGQYIIGAIKQASPPPGALVVDLGGGAGYMAALLKAHLGQQCTVLCTDIADEALDIARACFEENDLDAHALQGDMLEPVREFSPDPPHFVLFYPPQDGTPIRADGAGGGDSPWRGSPDVSLLAPTGDDTFFHERFCKEAELAEGGLAWLAVDWHLVQRVIEICCANGWEVRMPEAVRDIMDNPSSLIELQKRGPGSDVDDATCVAEAMGQVQLAAQHMSRAVGASGAEARVARYRTAAERGVVSAQTDLGVALVSGIGTAKDESEAASWFLRAATAGEINAQTNLGCLLAGGAEDPDAVPRNEEAAAEFFRRAALQGDMQAQAHLVALYVDGRIDPARHEDSPIWIRKAARRGNREAQTLLAKLHLAGEVVEQSHAEAARWLRAAAGSREGPEAEALRQAAAHLEEVAAQQP